LYNGTNDRNPSVEFKYQHNTFVISSSQPKLLLHDCEYILNTIPKTVTKLEICEYYRLEKMFHGQELLKIIKQHSQINELLIFCTGNEIVLNVNEVVNYCVETGRVMCVYLNDEKMC
jgi:hypothetical protein